jgi:UDP-N-acetylglucosamine--N-acetylmuramyl-(pentapeptide) pyrophosphoryl-undecaprenol N-acetylglucosamine transferase
VIFATVGSHPTYRFERLLRALEGVDAELVVQYGPGEPPANAAVAVPWMPFEEIVANMEKADHVVSHAGVGTILCAIQAGQVPLVFPRLARFGETVDDHQLDLARLLAETGKVVLVEEAKALPAALAAAPPRGEASDGGGEELIAAVRAELHQSG